MMEQSRQDLGGAFMGLLLRCHKSEKTIAASLGFSVDELHCLSRIYFDAPSCVKELSGALGMKASRTSIILRGLEQRGYLTRSLSLADRRMERVTLTDEGNKTAEKLLIVARQAAERFLASIPPHLAGNLADSISARSQLAD